MGSCPDTDIDPIPLTSYSVALYFDSVIRHLKLDS